MTNLGSVAAKVRVVMDIPTPLWDRVSQPALGLGKVYRVSCEIRVRTG
jgi:hypothetical protein